MKNVHKSPISIVYVTRMERGYIVRSEVIIFRHICRYPSLVAVAEVSVRIGHSIVTVHVLATMKENLLVAYQTNKSVKVTSINIKEKHLKIASATIIGVAIFTNAVHNNCLY